MYIHKPHDALSCGTATPELLAVVTLAAACMRQVSSKPVHNAEAKCMSTVHIMPSKRQWCHKLTQGKLLCVFTKCVVRQNIFSNLSYIV